VSSAWAADGPAPEPKNSSKVGEVPRAFRVRKHRAPWQFRLVRGQPVHCGAGRSAGPAFGPGRNLSRSVKRARELGATWAAIGTSLGMTRQSAWERLSGEEWLPVPPIAGSVGHIPVHLASSAYFRDRPTPQKSEEPVNAVATRQRADPEFGRHLPRLLCSTAEPRRFQWCVWDL